MNIRKMVIISLMISGALVLSLIDSRIILISVMPGIKIGIANIITLIVIRLFSWKEALLVTIVRCLLAGIFSGNPVSLILSLAGGVLSTLAMSALFRTYPRFLSMAGISVCGAEVHNMGQLLAVSALVGTPSVYVYVPYLLAAGAVSGFCMGILSGKVCNAVLKVQQ